MFTVSIYFVFALSVQTQTYSFIRSSFIRTHENNKIKTAFENTVELAMDQEEKGNRERLTYKQPIKKVQRDTGFWDKRGMFETVADNSTCMISFK